MKILVDNTIGHEPDKKAAIVMDLVTDAAAGIPGVCLVVHDGKRSMHAVQVLRSESNGRNGAPALIVSISGVLPLFWHPDRQFTKTAVAVYSLGFVSAPEGYSWLQRHMLNFRYHRLRRLADYFIAADRHVAADLHKYYFIPKEKIIVADDSAAMADVLSGIIRCRQSRG